MKAVFELDRDNINVENFLVELSDIEDIIDGEMEMKDLPSFYFAQKLTEHTFYSEDAIKSAMEDYIPSSITNFFKNVEADRAIPEMNELYVQSYSRDFLSPMDFTTVTIIRSSGGNTIYVVDYVGKRNNGAGLYVYYNGSRGFIENNLSKILNEQIVKNAYTVDSNAPRDMHPWETSLSYVHRTNGYKKYLLDMIYHETPHQEYNCTDHAILDHVAENDPGLYEKMDSLFTEFKAKIDSL